MTIKLLLLAILAACGVTPNSATTDPPTEQPGKEAPVELEDQHFCCKSVDHKTRSGEDCVLTAKEHVAMCAGDIMFCPGFYTMKGGTVNCPK